MSWYEFLLFVHVLGAAAWFGAGVLLLVLGARLERARDTAGMKSLFDQAQWLSTRFFVPSSLVVLVAGLLLVWEGDWSWHALWIEIGYIGFAVTFATGFFVLGPRAKKIAAVIEREGMSAEAVNGVRELFVLMRVDYAVLAVVVADMTLKPTTDDVEVLVGMAAAIVIVVATVLRSARAAPAPARGGGGGG